MKNTNFGKPLSQLITMVAICMLSLNAMAYDFSYTHQGKTLYYSITSDTTVYVTCLSEDIPDNNYVDGVVVIPSSVTNDGTTYRVDSIGRLAFYNCSNLTSVTIPDGITSIGNFAFGYCSNLTSVTIGNDVTFIGRYAFIYCTKELCTMSNSSSFGMLIKPYTGSLIIFFLFWTSISVCKVTTSPQQKQKPEEKNAN